MKLAIDDKVCETEQAFALDHYGMLYFHLFFPLYVFYMWIGETFRNMLYFVFFLLIFIVVNNQMKNVVAFLPEDKAIIYINNILSCMLDFSKSGSECFSYSEWWDIVFQSPRSISILYIYLLHLLVPVICSFTITRVVVEFICLFYERSRSEFYAIECELSRGYHVVYNFENKYDAKTRPYVVLRRDNTRNNWHVSVELAI